MLSDERVREVIGGFLKRAHQDIDAQAPRLAADVAAVLRTERQSWSQEHTAAFTRLLAAIRELDQAASLSDILKALAKGAMTEASRVAMMLVDQSELRIWGHFGFGTGPGPVDLVADERSLLDRAVAMGVCVTVPSLASGEERRPAFMRMPPGHIGLIAPLLVGGNVVVLLYADGLERQPDLAHAPVWAEQVEVLVRHAALRLENVTSLRAVEVLTRSA
jgi:hypothetical protein